MEQSLKHPLFLFIYLFLQMKILIFTKRENVFQLKCQKPIYLQDGIE